MKRLVQILALILVGNLVMAQGNSNNNNNNNPHTSENSGMWQEDNTWEGDEPGDTFGNNVEFYITSDTKVETSESFTLTFNNNAVIQVYGTLIINGNIEVNNNLEVNVHDGGSFIVNGSITMNNNADIEVNGELAAESIKGKSNNNISGSGNVYVDDIEGVEYDGFEGDMVVDMPSFEIMKPELVTVHELDYLTVELTWDFEGEDEIIINGNTYEWVGFRVVRNLYEDNYFRTIVAGEFAQDNEGNFIFNNNATQKKFIDLIDEDEFLNASEQNAGDEENVLPVYYVRAIYQVKSAKENKNQKSEDDFKLGPKSENLGTTEPLPIELLSFDANTGAEGVNIQWSTATEINNDYFTLERSTDGQSWEVLAYVQGHGNSNQVIHYDYTDAFPLEGVSYYRLKQTDFDGQFEYFSPVAVMFSSVKTGMEIVNTNVNNQGVEVWLQNQVPGAELIIADVTGRILHTQKVESYDYTQQLQIELSQGGSGKILLVRLNAGQHSDAVKVFAR